MEAIHYGDLSVYPTSRLIDAAAECRREQDAAKERYDALAAEVQKRAIKTIEDRNIKFTELWGSGQNLAAVTVAQKVEVLNYTKLAAVLDADVLAAGVERIQGPTTYKLDKRLQRAAVALVLGEYVSDMTVERVLDGIAGIDGDKKRILQKKLKGDYNADKKALKDALNLDQAVDLDTELYLIYQIRNWELIRGYFDTEQLTEIKDKLTECLLVDETAKFGIKTG